MDRESAISYLEHSVEQSKLIMKRKFHYEFLFVNLVFLAIAVALYFQIIFVIGAVIIALINLIFIIILLNKINYMNIMKLSVVQMSVFCITLNGITFGLKKLINNFVLWEFLVSLGIQFLAFIIGYFIVKKFANNYKQEGTVKSKVLAGTFAGLGYSLGLLLCRIFAPSLQVGVVIITFLLNLLVCLISFGVVAAIYRIYLIKKYKLNINLL